MTRTSDDSSPFNGLLIIERLLIIEDPSNLFGVTQRLVHQTDNKAHLHCNCGLVCTIKGTTLGLASCVCGI